MKSEFLKPRFVGQRFEDATLPLDVARDLAALQELIGELAKHLYLSDHPGRQRVPRGFAADFRLDIAGVEAGSAVPVLALVTGAGLAPGEGTNPYFERARDLVIEVIARDGDDVPETFPRALLDRFNVIGKSLRAGERVELARQGVGDDVATLTPEKRRVLALAAHGVYQRDVELVGYIEEIDAKARTFRLRTSDRGTAVVGFGDDQFRELPGALDQQRWQVVVTAVAEYDRYDTLKRVVQVTRLDVRPNVELAARLDELAMLNDGWFDGAGKAPDADGLAWLEAHLLRQFPKDVPLPMIVPTPEGNVLFEWSVPGEPSVDFELAERTAHFHGFAEDGGDIERVFTLRDERGWSYLFDFLRGAVRGDAA